MGTTSYINSLPDFVDQEKLTLVGKSIFGATTLQTIQTQDGVKGSAAINLLDVDVKFQSASTCGFNATSSATLSQREIKAVPIKINLQFCPETLYNKYAGKLARVAAGEEVLPFEQMVCDEITKGIQAKLEQAIWVSNTDDSDSEYDAEFNLFDGFREIISDESDVVDVTFSGSDTYITKVQKMISAIPANIQDAEDLMIFSSPEFFQSYLFALVNANLYHYNPGDATPTSVVIPGSSVTLKKINGLKGKSELYAGRASNFVFGTDMTTDYETFKLWYSDDDDMFKFKCKFLAGVQVKFPDEIVLGK